MQNDAKKNNSKAILRKLKPLTTVMGDNIIYKVTMKSIIQKAGP